MKRTLLMLAVCALSLTLAAFGGETAAKVKIGVLAPAVTHGWVAGVAFYAEKRCQELNDQIEYKIFTSETAEQMTNQLEEAQNWGVKAVVAFPQWTGMEAPIKRALKAGIQVVNFDIAINADGVYRVSGDNAGMGKAGAKYIVDKLGKDITIVTLPVPTAGSVSELRMQGFNETIKELAPNAKIIERATKFTQEDGLKDFADILTKTPKIDAVYSLDDETSLGVLQAIKEAGRQDVKVVTGGGGAQKYFSVMPKYQDIWVQSALYSPSMVMDAVDIAVKLAKGETVAEKVKVIPSKVVDRDNCKDFIDPKSPY